MKNTLFKNNRLLKFFTIIFASFVVIAHPIEVLSVNLYQEGPYTYNNDSLIISSDGTFQNRTYTFNKGQTIFVRLTTTRFQNQILTNRLSLQDFKGGIITQATFTQTTFSSPYTFQASIVVPTNVSSYVLLDTVLEWGTVVGAIRTVNGRLTANQALEINTVPQNIRYYSDNQYAQEKYAFKNTDTLYAKLWGSGENVAAAAFTLVKMDGTTQVVSLPATSVAREGNWYKIGFNLSALSSLQNGNWYTGKFVLRTSANTMIAAPGKLFLIDTASPTTSITAPINNATVGGVVNITGTASDLSLKQYVLQIREPVGSGSWTTIYTGINSVTNNTLYQWDTGSLAGKTVDMQLIASDYAGNNASVVVTNVRIDGVLSYVIPSSSTLSTITASTQDVKATGSIGDGGSNDIKISDGRANKPGWSMTVKFTDFTALGEVIPVTGLKIIPQPVRAVSGSMDGIIIGTAHIFTGIDDTASLMSAPSGKGAGTYMQQALLELVVPANTSAGQYSGTATITIL